MSYDDFIIKNSLKFELFAEKMNDEKKLNEEISILFETLFKKTFKNILKKTGFFQSLFAEVNITLIDHYTERIFQNISFIKLFTNISKKFEKKINDYKNSFISQLSENSENNENLKNFRKHCANTGNFAFHNCNFKNGEKGSFKIVSDIFTKNKKFVICKNCKKVYRLDCFKNFCEFCNKNYYTSLLTQNEINNKNIFKATLLSSHCPSFSNEKLFCNNCKNILYINLNSNKIQCLECGFNSDTKNITSICKQCNSKYKTNIIIYNPLERKIISNSIKEALILKKAARPKNVPCCKEINRIIGNTFFYHNKNCKGILYFGEYYKKLIMVCEKCQALNYYYNFKWTCPLCEKVFKEKFFCLNEKKFFMQGFENYIIKKGENDNEKNKKIRSKSQKTPKNIKNNNLFDKKINIRYYSSGNKNINKKTNNKNKNNIIVVNLPCQERYLSIVSSNSKNENNNNSKNTESKNDDNLNNKTEINNNTNVNNWITQNTICQKMFGNIIEPQKLDCFLNKLEQTKFIANNTNIRKISEDQSKRKVNLKKYKPKKYESNKSNSKLLEIPTLVPISNINALNVSKYLKTINHRNKTYKSDKKSQTLTETINVNLNKNNLKIVTTIPQQNIMPSDIIEIYNIKEDIPVDDINLINNKYEYDELQRNLKHILSKGKIPQFNLENYEISKKVGGGSFGEVFEVIEKNTQNKFALKKIKITETPQLDLIRKEFDLIHSSHHPNILDFHAMSVHCINEKNILVYILMDLAIRDWEIEIKERQKYKDYYTENELISILKQLTNALYFLQKEQCIAHRDIKLENILICNYDEYKICDFGEAKRKTECKSIKEVKGTDIYMSPILYNALIEGKEFVEQDQYKSDLYSLGFSMIIAASLDFKIIFGIRKAQSIERKIKKIIEKGFNGRYSGKFIEIMLKMIKYNENDRPDFVEFNQILKDEFS